MLSSTQDSLLAPHSGITPYRFGVLSVLDGIIPGSALYKSRHTTHLVPIPLPPRHTHPPRRPRHTRNSKVTNDLLETGVYLNSYYSIFAGISRTYLEHENSTLMTLYLNHSWPFSVPAILLSKNFHHYLFAEDSFIVQTTSTLMKALCSRYLGKKGKLNFILLGPEWKENN